MGGHTTDGGDADFTRTHFGQSEKRHRAGDDQSEIHVVG